MNEKKKILQKDKCKDIPLNEIKECNADDYNHSLSHKIGDIPAPYKIGFKMNDGTTTHWDYAKDKDARDKAHTKITKLLDADKEYVKI